MRKLTTCAKAYTSDLDKAVTPAETIARVRALLAERAEGVLETTRRMDTGRLGIPVYMSVYGPRAAEFVPTRKQMGKGSSPEQAEASALMELVERYGFFTFFASPGNFRELTWAEAEEAFGEKLLPLAEMLASVGESMAEADARAVLNLVRFRFCPALRLADGREFMVPADWFKLLNEYNGSCAGNTLEESALQGLCELVERHVSARAEIERPELPTIELSEAEDATLARLAACYARNGVTVILKDFSYGMPVPTVGAVGYDLATFPHSSEIVFTAGTASSPAKAAIRALTEVAQLAGDFHSGAVYEPSGLSKPAALEEIDWLKRGPAVPLSTLPSAARADIREEVELVAGRLAEMGFNAYLIDTSPPDLGIQTNYCFVPGFDFLERSRQASLGLFIGRRLSEEAEPEEALRGLKVLADVYGEAAFIPFFEAMLAMRVGDNFAAALKFEKAAPLQPDADNRALSLFYAAYAYSQEGDWAGAEPLLDAALADNDQVKEYFNLRGVARFKRGAYEAAAGDFQAALALDKGSVMDMANLGLCYKFLGRAQEAAEYLERALAHDSTLEFARKHLVELTGPAA